MEKTTRNSIQHATQAARKLLEDDYREQLEGTFDVLLDGTIAPHPGTHLSAQQRIGRAKLVAAIHHKRSNGLQAKEAIDAYLREAAFTTLNRFVALKMLEARDLLQECVSKGDDSAGFKEFTALAPGLVSLDDKGYQLYLESLFDEIGQEVKVLFDRHDVASLLWPERHTLLELLSILNDPNLSSVWAEDETIGWVYQYFNGDEERTKMRAESQAPRNSRELAVRNQFFTPRYVVQFLTDNTLGRIWYEMMQGDTQLAHLDYLVRRPNEIFLSEGESAPESDTDDSELIQEELLQQTVHVPFRARKDPRDLHILDPACGSGHFLLYTFDLLITVYEEAWTDAGAAAFTETDTQLRADYESLEDLRRVMPELILRHNLHGVDIDPRATQIAALALWMRAQRAYNQFEVDRSQRPPITKTNIVVAEPMPGDAELVDEFAASLKPAVLGDLFKKMVKEMKLAGELGSLLKIEESIANAVNEAAEASLQGNLFGEKVESQDFWGTADEKIIAALGSFAEAAAGAGGVRRQLFAGDAAQGVAFIELMRKRFDAVLMNPPFGKGVLQVKTPYEELYPRAKADVYAGFVERGRELIFERGMVGALTSRVGLFASSLQNWRLSAFLGCGHVRALADLGHGVLDDALVEAAAYILTSGDRPSSFWATSLLDEKDKSRALRKQVGMAERSMRSFAALDALPGSPMAFWVAPLIGAKFQHIVPLSPTSADACVGLQTDDDFRFLRLAWEVPVTSIPYTWRFFAKGGEYSPYYDDIHLTVLWHNEARELRSFIEQKYSWTKRASSATKYGTAGLTYPERTTSEFSPRPLPANTVFSIAGPGILPTQEDDAFRLLSLFYTRWVRLLIEVLIGGGDAVHSGSAARHYKAGHLNVIPLPPNDSADTGATLSNLGSRCAQIRASFFQADETSRLFTGLPLLERSRSFESWCREALVEWESNVVELETASWEIEEIVPEVYSLPRGKHREFVQSEYGWHPAEYTGHAEGAAVQRLMELGEDALVDELTAIKGFSRQFSKLSFWSDRRYEVIAHILSCSVQEVVSARQRSKALPSWWGDSKWSQLVSFVMGLSFRRWTSEGEGGFGGQQPDLLAELPALPPRGSTTSDGPAVLVDDLGATWDLISQMSKQAEQVGIQWWDEILSPSGDTKRKWLAKRFFSIHLGHYSKSRRRAPIYWQLATPSASYSVWCYYHRLTRDTFFRVSNDYVTPKVEHEELKLNVLRQEAGPDPSTKQRKEIDAQETFVAELRAFLTEVERIAPLWNPNLNDGVIINFAPLWRLAPQHKDWQKECKTVWGKLVKGEYDWANLAMHLWPERVVPKCAKDRSLAIAHGLEEEFWYENGSGKWKSRKVARQRVDEIVAERSSTAVKEALESLLAAPAPSGSSKRRGRNRGGA